jgi:hypothetical protein
MHFHPKRRTSLDKNFDFFVRFGGSLSLRGIRSGGAFVTCYEKTRD